MTDSACSGCGASIDDLVEGKPRAGLVLVTVELGGRSTTTRDAITTLHLCRRCYRDGGYGEQPQPSPTRTTT